ncbi:hypothetical protein CCUS01_14541 [Colletotrichum cuscutae]|uniref:Uncharacterized protein n=1 Tax=Colletotrichum cuscutae TaxID=1209917 RepID=A0AAI9Y8V0_9PEZI|nr:hypothetical protein CCUS01_14541 [Colletotrichum cuscutae]
MSTSLCIPLEDACLAGRPMGATFKDKVGALPNPDDEFGITPTFLTGLKNVCEDVTMDNGSLSDPKGGNNHCMSDLRF